MSLPEKLVCLRKEKRLTQLQLAERMHVSRQAISRWEAGEAIPSTENLKCLSDLYGVPVDYLLNDGIERPDQSEMTEEKPSEPQATGRKLKRRVIMIVCILIIAVATVLIYRGGGRNNAQNLDFSEMGSENWDTTEASEFTLDW